MIICFIIGGILAGMGAFLLTGRGGFLIAGFNSMSKEEKARWDERALCKFIGKIILPIGVMVALIGVEALSPWSVYAGLGVTLALTAFAIIYANGGKRFLTENAESIANEKTAAPRSAIIAAIILTAAITLAIVILFMHGARDPVVTVNSESIVISSMFGTTINFGSVVEVHLIEQSMNNIGVGIRTNGFGGVGDAYKGSFDNDSYGKVLLFVRANSSPTIRIERTGARDVFISFKDGEKTRGLYEKIMAEY
jgi:hypothetical protein